MKHLGKRQQRKNRCFELTLLAAMQHIPTELSFYTREENEAARLALLEVLTVLKQLYPKAICVRYGQSHAPTPWAERFYGVRLIQFQKCLKDKKYNAACENLEEMIHSYCACDRAAMYTWIKLLEEHCHGQEKRCIPAATD